MYNLGPIEPLALTQDQAQLCLYICEFLYFAIRNHGFRSKYILLSSDLFARVLQLYRSKYVYIKLGTNYNSTKIAFIFLLIIFMEQVDYDFLECACRFVMNSTIEIL